MPARTFGDLFKQLRGKLGLGLREFCMKNKFDPGNISKLERSKLPPPGDEALKRYAKALRLKEGSDQWREFFDLAAAARRRIPKDIGEDEELLARMPLLFRSLRDRGKMGTYAMVHLLKDTLARNASDFTVASGNPPYCCVGGEISFLGKQTITPSEADRLMRSVASDDHQQALHKTGHVEFGFAFEDVARFRVSALYKDVASGPVMRLFVISRNI